MTKQSQASRANDRVSSEVHVGKLCAGLALFHLSCYRHFALSRSMQMPVPGVGMRSCQAACDDCGGDPAIYEKHSAHTLRTLSLLTI